MRKQSFAVEIKNGVTIFILLLAVDAAVFAQDEQPLVRKPPTEEQMKQIRAALNKAREERQNYPTKEQKEELNREMAPVEARLEAASRDAHRLLEKHRDEAKKDPNIMVSRETIAESIQIHKAYRAAYFEAISIHSKWGGRNHREVCVRQAVKEKTFLTPMSDKWLATMPVMPLGEVLQRYAASEYMDGGELVGYTLGVGRWGGGAELLRLQGVCAGVAESEPGSD